MKLLHTDYNNGIKLKLDQHVQLISKYLQKNIYKSITKVSNINMYLYQRPVV